VSNLLESFYQPRSEKELRQQPFTPHEWTKTKAALRQTASLLHLRRDELATHEARLNLMARKNNLGNVTKMLPKRFALNTVIAGLEQMQAELELRMQILTGEVESNLQALRLHYEEAQAQIDSLFAPLRTGQGIEAATERLQTTYAQVEAISNHLLRLGYPFDESSFRASCARISKALRLPPSTHLQLLAQIQDRFTESTLQSPEGEALQEYRPSRQVAELVSFLLDSSR
jgi:hypothetical protein